MQKGWTVNRIPRRYTGPSAASIAALLPGSQRPDSQGRRRLRGICHGHGDRPDSASLVIRDRSEGGISVRCWAGCDRQTIITAIERATGLVIWEAWEKSEPLPSSHGATEPGGPQSRSTAAQTHLQDPLARPTGQSANLQRIAWDLWNKHTLPIPTDPEHPTRLWMAARNLWRPELPPPGALRWLPAENHFQGKGKHTGAGSLVALVAAPKAWEDCLAELAFTAGSTTGSYGCSRRTGPGQAGRNLVG